MPTPYADLLESRPALDAPFPDIKDRADIYATVQLLISAGSQLHLTGDGGDEVLQAGYSYLRDLLFKRPLTAASHLRGHHALRRWAWRTLAGFTAPGGSYRSWLVDCGRKLDLPIASGESAFTAWGGLFRLPPWASPAATGLARELVEQATADAEPLASTVGQHAALSAIRQSGRIMRRISQFAAALGLRLDAPFLDDRVIEACLAVRLHERTTPWRYKPLPVEAMKGLVPDQSLARTTKAETSSLVYRGMRDNRANILALCEDSMLAARGMVDPEQQRAQCDGLWTSDLIPLALSRTLGCERWLRDCEESTVAIH